MKIPGIGPVEKKWVYVGGALVAGIVGYAYWNKARVSNAESEISDYTTDPDYAMDSGVDEYVNPGGSQPPVVVDENAAPTTNAEWSKQAAEYLTETGYEPLTVAAALGLFFARQPLSKLQVEIIRAAEGRLGPPPVGTYPVTPTPDAPPPTPTPTPKLTAPTGLSAHDIGKTTVGFLWNAVTGARYYSVYLSNGKHYNTASTHVSITGLKSNTTYKAQVRAYDMQEKPGPLSPTRTFKTKK
jgi:hypothetical protein